MPYARQLGNVTAGVLVLALIAASAGAQPKAGEGFKTVTYDVADFVGGGRPDDQPDLTAAGLTAEMPIGAPPGRTRTQTREGFVTLVRETIDPRSWQPAGAGGIALEGDRLVVSQTAGNHRAIVSMFGQLREKPEEGKVLEAFKNAPRLAKGTRFDGAEVAIAVAAIGKAAGVAVEVDYNALAKFNVEFDSVVTADVSGQRPAGAIRTLIRTVSKLELPVVIGATKKTITVGIDTGKDDARMSRGFDVRRIPAGASGLDFKQPRARKDVVDALVKRVEKECGVKGVRESYGMLIVGGTGKTLREVGRYLDELEDAPLRGGEKP